MVRLELDITHVLVRPNGSFRYRRVVPPQDQPAIGRKNWIHTWKRGTPIETVRLGAAAWTRKYDRLLAEARGEVVSDAGVKSIENYASEIITMGDAKRYELLALLGKLEAVDIVTPRGEALKSALINDGKYIPNTMVLTAALAQDEERYGDRRQSKSYATAVKSFVDCQGDLDIASITRNHVAAYIAARKQEGKKPGTINKRLSNLRALLNRTFLDLDHEGRNPFHKQAVKDDVAAVDKRPPMDANHISKLDAYLAGSNSVDRDAKNILNIIRNTGAGPAEIAGLKVADVYLDSPIPFVHLQFNDVRRLKNKDRVRKVPLVGLALDAAKDAMSAATGPNLFNSITTSTRTIDVMGNKLNKTIRDAGIEDRTTYGLRHSIVDAMRFSGAPEYLQRRLIGHAATSTKDKTYGGQENRSAMHAAITKALDHLGHFDDDDC